MRKALLPIAGILLLGAGVAMGWFSAHRGTPDSEQKTEPGRLADEPALEEVGEAEEALRLAGFDSAFVYRWRGALLDGYVLLDTARETERVALNTEQVANNAHRNQQQAAEREAERPIPQGKAQLDPARIRGLIVIAIRPKATGTKVHECMGTVKVTVEAEDKRTMGTSTSTLFSGQLPDLSGGGGGQGGGHAFYMLNMPGGEERELYKLQLRAR